MQTGVMKLNVDTRLPILRGVASHYANIIPTHISRKEMVKEIVLFKKVQNIVYKLIRNNKGFAIWQIQKTTCSFATFLNYTKK